MDSQAFELDRVMNELRQSRHRYLGFLRVPDVSVGLYALPAGGVDPQQPHTEDEVYYVIGGRATIRAGGEDRPLKPGSIVYVKAGVEHHFHSIVEDLSVLVFFAPAEGTGTA